MPQTEAQKRANAKYQLKAYEDIRLRVKRGKKLIMKNHADSKGESLNAFINRAIDETIERESEQ